LVINAIPNPTQNSNQPCLSSEASRAMPISATSSHSDSSTSVSPARAACWKPKLASRQIVPSQALSRPSRRSIHACSTPTVATPANADTARAVNSLTPKRRYRAAVSHISSGGFSIHG
jgi:hypothetical protein